MDTTDIPTNRYVEALDKPVSLDEVYESSRLLKENIFKNKWCTTVVAAIFKDKRWITVVAAMFKNKWCTTVVAAIFKDKLCTTVVAVIFKDKW